MRIQGDEQDALRFDFDAVVGWATRRGKLIRSDVAAEFFGTRPEADPEPSPAALAHVAVIAAEAVPIRSRRAFPVARVIARIVRLLDVQADGRPSGVLVDAAFGDDGLLTPIISCVTLDRSRDAERDTSLIPDVTELAVEVISPNDVGYEIEAKVAEYLAAGFGTVWVVYPNVRIVRVHRAGVSSREYRGDDEITGEPFLPSFRGSVRAFFE